MLVLLKSASICSFFTLNCFAVELLSSRKSQGSFGPPQALQRRQPCSMLEGKRRAGEELSSRRDKRW